MCAYIRGDIAKVTVPDPPRIVQGVCGTWPSTHNAGAQYKQQMMCSDVSGSGELYGHSLFTSFKGCLASTQLAEITGAGLQS